MIEDPVYLHSSGDFERNASSNSLSPLERPAYFAGGMRLPPPDQFGFPPKTIDIHLQSPEALQTCATLEYILGCTRISKKPEHHAKISICCEFSPCRSWSSRITQRKTS